MDAAEIRHAFFMTHLHARGQMVTVGKPQYVDGLSFVVYAKPRSERAKMRLNSPDTETQQQPGIVMRPCVDIRAQHFELAPCGR